MSIFYYPCIISFGFKKYIKVPCSVCLLGHVFCLFGKGHPNLWKVGSH